MSNRPLYTATEIQAMANGLPGLTLPGDVLEIFGGDPAYAGANWQPVLSTTILSTIDGTPHVLTGTRTAGGNTTHTNVASTPTIRIPSEEASFLLFQPVPFCLNGKIDPLNPFVSDSLYPSIAPIPDSTDVLSAKVGYLLALKLGLGSVLETARQPIGRTSVARCIIGFSAHEGKVAEPLFEPLIMFGAVVGLQPEAAAQIPKRSVSYDRLGWTPVERYLKGVSERSVIDVIPTATDQDELDVCIKGLCNATSFNILQSLDDAERHLTRD